MGGIIGSHEKEKTDILQRKNWLVDKIVVEPRQLLKEMPRGLGLQFQGEWAFCHRRRYMATIVSWRISETFLQFCDIGHAAPVGQLLKFLIVDIGAVEGHYLIVTVMCRSEHERLVTAEENLTLHGTFSLAWITEAALMQPFLFPFLG